MAIPIKFFLLWFQRYGIFLVILLVGAAVLFAFKLNKKDYVTQRRGAPVPIQVVTTGGRRREISEEYESKLKDGVVGSLLVPKIPSESELKQKWMRDKVERLSKKVKNSNIAKLVYMRPFTEPNYNVHVFYYPWYGNIEHDGEWKHWNHEYLPNWKKEDKKVYPSGRHKPPDDIGSSFYPALGCYSSRDPAVIDVHMRQIRDAGIGVLVVSWYPPDERDTSDDFFALLLDAASKFRLHIAPHMEPYEGRNAINQLRHLRYFFGKYGNHSSLHRMRVKERNLPVLYIYDSYRIEASAWRELLSGDGHLTVRGTNHDGVFFGLLVDMQHRYEIKKSHFDGFYTYFASNGFSYGSSWKNWQQLGKFAEENGLLFAPSVGPGYVDVTVRPWNGGSTRHRRRGHYYEVAWRTAISASPSVVTVTSFNEWHEGTQIEPARPKTTRDGLFTYLDYEPEGSHFYLNLTNYWIRKFSVL